MIHRHQFFLADYIFQRDSFCVSPIHRHHNACLPFFNIVHTGSANSCGKQAVCRRGGSTALIVAEDGHAGFKPGHLLKLLREAQRIVAVVMGKRGKSLIHLLRRRLVSLRFGSYLLVFQLPVFFILPFVESPLRHGNNTEIGAALLPMLYRCGNHRRIIGYFRNENDICPAGNTGTESQPARVVSHYFTDNNAMMTMRRRVETVEGIRGDFHGSIKSKGDISHGDIIIDGLRQSNDVESLLMQAESILLRAATANTNQHIKVVTLIIVADGISHIHHLTAHRHFVRLVAAGTEDRAPPGQDGGQGLPVKTHGAVLHQAAETVAKAKDAHIPGQGSLADSANSCVETRTVASGSQYSDVKTHILLRVYLWYRTSIRNYHPRRQKVQQITKNRRSQFSPPHTANLMKPGTLYIVPTPIGNLEDVTLRALRILKEVDLIAAEDTRHSRKLLTHFGIDTRLVSYYREKEAEKARGFVKLLEGGKDLALISDAGTPAISDPGAILVRAVQEAGLTVVPLPGASAVTSAFSASGILSAGYTFLGFPPAKSGARQKFLQKRVHHDLPVVLYESPRRIEALLEDSLEVLGERDAFFARELTKSHEELLSGTISTLLTRVREGVRGEFVLIICPAVPEEVSGESLEELLLWHRDNSDISVKDVSKKLAGDLGISKSKVYQMALKLWQNRPEEENQ